MHEPTFVLVAQERTGSTWLMHALAPACLHEIWHWSRRSSQVCGGLDPDDDPIAYLGRWRSAYPGARGAKLLMGQTPLDTTSALFRGVDRVILLGRLNLTEQAVSYQLARRFKDWQQESPRPATTDPRELDTEELVEFAEMTVAHRSAAVRLLRHKLRPVMNVWYEGLDLNAVNALRTFVGLPTTDRIESPFVVWRDQAFYRQAIANYDQINTVMGQRYGVLFGAPGTRWSEPMSV